MIFRLAAWDRRWGASGRAEDRSRRRLRPTLLVLEERKLLSTIVVNNPTDTPAVGQIDLRQAIATANTSGGSETITFDSTVFATAQTIKLTNGPLELSDTTGTETITGPAAGLTINGGGLSGVFQVDKGTTASITGLTITGGLAVGNGGGVSNSGTLTMTDCTISGNTAGNGSDTGDGGGLYNNGTLSLIDSTVTANRATGNYFSSDGGGLFNSGTLTATNCTVAGNSVREYIGGGGGIQNSGGTATLTNTIVINNSYSYAYGSGPTDIASTATVAGTYNLIGTGGSGGLVNGIAGNLVGVADPGLGALGYYGGPTETIPLLPGSPAIDAGTSAGAPATDQRGEPRVGAVDIGAFESQGFKLTPVAGSTPQTANIGVTFANPLAVTVTANNPVEPVNGGVVNFAASPASNGATAILLTSSAVIAGGQAGVTGGPNNMDGSYTVTASGPGLAATSLELTNAGPTLTSLAVNTTSSSLFAGAGLLSLPLAVAFANTDTSGNANISFDPGVFGTSQTITLTGSQLELSNTGEAETITGPVAGVTISGARLSRVLQIDGGVTATITGLTISGGLTAGNGGGVSNSGTLTVTGCTVNGNTAGIGAGPADGGGIYNDGTLTVTDSTVTANLVEGDYSASFGGGLFNSGTLNVISSTITANFARYYGAGGGLQNSGGTATLTDTIVTGNKTYFGAGDIAGTVTGTYNLIGTGGSGGLANGVGGNLVGVAQPGLGALGHYGGPTETIPLLPGSPAIDAGTSTGAPATDQRGEPRVGAVDIGAFESQGFTLTSVAGSTPQT
ncbi:MAG: choice-of-anchor Q domain-containing protein, partial [Isosphaeraceae bacterium]